MTEVTEHKHRTLSPEHLRNLDLGLFTLGVSTEEDCSLCKILVCRELSPRNLKHSLVWNTLCILA